jgi:hypothetical protein
LTCETLFTPDGFDDSFDLEGFPAVVSSNRGRSSPSICGAKELVSHGRGTIVVADCHEGYEPTETIDSTVNNHLPSDQLVITVYVPKSVNKGHTVFSSPGCLNRAFQMAFRSQIPDSSANSLASDKDPSTAEPALGHDITVGVVPPLIHDLQE